MKQACTYTLLLNPILAKKLGSNEAMAVCQIHYWLQKSENVYENSFWVYNTLDQWLEQFTFLSKSTLRRIFKKLEDMGVILAKKIKAKRWNQTKWYTLNYQKIKEIIGQSLHNMLSNPKKTAFVQNEHIDVVKVNTCIQKNTIHSTARRNSTNDEKITKNIALADLNLMKEREVRTELKDWSLSTTEKATLAKEFSWDQDRIENEENRFKTYYAGKKRGNWKVTWGLWCQRAIQFAEERNRRLAERRFTKKEKPIGKVITDEEAAKVEASVKAARDILEKKKHAESSGNEIWVNVSERVLSVVGDADYVSWIKDLKFEGIKDGSAVLRATNKFCLDNVKSRFVSNLEESFKFFSKDVFGIKLVC